MTGVRKKMEQFGIWKEKSDIPLGKTKESKETLQIRKQLYDSIDDMTLQVKILSKDFALNQRLSTKLFNEWVAEESNVERLKKFKIFIEYVDELVSNPAKETVRDDLKNSYELSLEKVMKDFGLTLYYFNQSLLDDKKTKKYSTYGDKIATQLQIPLLIGSYQALVVALEPGVKLSSKGSDCKR